MPPATDVAIRPPTVAPSLARGLIAVPAGVHTEIVQIIAPANASAGEIVTVQVKVKNLYTTGIYIAVTGLVNTTELFSHPEFATVEIDENYTFTMTFAMPNYDVQVRAFSYYWAEDDWYQDDESSVNVSLAGEAVWVKLATQVVTIEPEEAPPVAWIKLASEVIILTPTVAVCTTDADCLPGYICQDGVCVKEVPPEEKRFPWSWVLIGGGASIAIIGIASTGRKI